MSDQQPSLDPLLAPCRWCGYNGSGYWQAGTHAPTCRWFAIGGEVTRRYALAPSPPPPPPNRRRYGNEHWDGDPSDYASPAPPPNKGHIDLDCEVVRGVGWMCTCETPEEKAQNEAERAECEPERDAQSLPAPPPVGEEPSVTTDPLEMRVRSYLGNGGLLNPELMEHDKVQRLILDLHAALATERQQHAEQIATMKAMARKAIDAGAQIIGTQLREKRESAEQIKKLQADIAELHDIVSGHAEQTRLEIEKACAAERHEIAFDIAENPNNEWTRELRAQHAEQIAETNAAHRDAVCAMLRLHAEQIAEKESELDTLASQLRHAELDRDGEREFRRLAESREAALRAELDEAREQMALNAAVALQLDSENESRRQEIETLRAELDTVKQFLEKRGYRRCDIAACNCNGYHGGHSAARLVEIGEALEEAGLDMNGRTLLEGVNALRQEIETLKQEKP